MLTSFSCGYIVGTTESFYAAFAQYKDIADMDFWDGFWSAKDNFFFV